MISLFDTTVIDKVADTDPLVQVTVNVPEVVLYIVKTPDPDDAVTVEVPPANPPVNVKAVELVHAAPVWSYKEAVTAKSKYALGLVGDTAN